jgi:hypothetical protein
MIEPDWIVEDKLVVSSTPVVSNSAFAVNNQRLNTQHLQSSGDGEACLSGTCMVLITSNGR